MGRIVELEKVELKAREYDRLTGRVLSDKKITIGYAIISVDIDKLLNELLPKKAEEEGIDLSRATAQEKKELLVKMGYKKYLDKLAKEEGFEWLSETL